MVEQHGKTLVPQIRFAGFTDPWEQRKLGELYKEVSEKNDLTYGRDRIISVAHMYFNPVVYVTEDDYLKTYNVMRLGDIAFEGNRSKNFAHGRLVENTIGDGIVSHVFKVFRPIQPFDLMYWKYSINNEKAMKDVLTRSTKASTMMHELVAKDFLNEEIAVPSLEEQRQIGAFFDRLDSLITLHQRKYDKLCVLKKSMLDKMFPKGGSLYPEIRFAGFTDPWEQRKLGELFEEHSEKDRDDLPALTIIQGGGTVHRDESKRNLQFDRSSLSNYKVVDTGDFIVHLRSFEGGLEKATCYGLVSPAYHIFRGKNVDSDFYYLYFRSKRFIDVDLKPHVYGIRDGRSIDIEGMKTIFIPWTNLAEQRRIGGFFDRLDSLITLHQRKLELLRNIKKSMLDKMFV